MKLYIFSIFPMLLILLALIFRKKQNKGEFVGGEISLPKSLWLSYTIGSWFLFPLILLSYDIAIGLQYVLIFHLISFYIRGVLELFMIYKWYNWSPFYGISHDLFHLLGVVFLFLFFWPQEISRITLIGIFYIFGIIISVCFESLFAILFYKIRGKEKHKVYFASNSSEWKTVNKITWFAVILCYGLHFLNAWGIRELTL